MKGEMTNKQMLRFLSLFKKDINNQRKKLAFKKRKRLNERNLTKSDYVKYYGTLPSTDSKKYFNRLPKYLRKSRVQTHQRLKEVYNIKPNLKSKNSR